VILRRFLQTKETVTAQHRLHHSLALPCSIVSYVLYSSRCHASTVRHLFSEAGPNVLNNANNHNLLHIQPGAAFIWYLHDRDVCAANYSWEDPAGSSGLHYFATLRQRSLICLQALPLVLHVSQVNKYFYTCSSLSVLSPKRSRVSPPPDRPKRFHVARDFRVLFHTAIS
jgi:hypothetical protein